MLGLLIVVACVFAELVGASVGDRSQMFHTCLQSCITANCTDPINSLQLPIHLRILCWSCSDECKYICTWPSVEWFITSGVGVQQFYGKWPFVRFFGIQEPAAVFFSLLNLASHVFMIHKFRQAVHPDTPFYKITHLYCLICCHGWFWSSVFHTRDVRFTEIMDYLGALSMVLFSLYHLLIRLRGTDPTEPVSRAIAVASVLYFFYHSYTVFFVKMDYGYNMICSIILGAANAIGWLVWCWRNSKKLPYVRNCTKFVFLVAATTLLELIDFPPVWWIFDSHALWHLSTSPLAILWYSFLIDDCRHMRYERMSLDKIA